MDMAIETQNYQDFLSHLRLYFSWVPRDFNLFMFKDFCKKSQREKVYWHLLEYGKITNKQCQVIYGICHAPSVIRDIRNKLEQDGDNYRIINCKKAGCNRFGNPTDWVEYTLVPKVQDAA